MTGALAYQWRCRNRVEMARPTGFKCADARSLRIPIEGANVGLMAEGA
jgi:hypothetical protein